MTIPILKPREQSWRDKEAARDYAAAVKEGRAAPGDEDLAEAYRHLARGRTLIDLLSAFAATGVDGNGRPRLAIAPADAEWVYFDFTADAVYFSAGATRYGLRDNSRRLVEIPRLPSFGLAAFPSSAHDVKAMLPSIPPAKRPKIGRREADLSRYHVLWEAEWHPAVPKDPYLLLHVRGFLYRVVAHWDLTPVEQAVLRTRVQ